ncbi:MAG: lipoyl(octanoyl) transferase LipB [Halothiobacillaceae bacterium]|nr:MAG: lipoyl(octanoyl) transferase LipB [Halothiobacillaceae bacterium]
MPTHLRVRDLGLQPYADSFEAMRAFTAARTPSTPDELWLVEHPPIFTQGLNGQPEHLLMPGDIPVVRTDRGGQVTYHGPGQLVGYLLFDLGRARLGVRDTVEHLEQAVIGLLAGLGIEAASKRDAPGVYVDGAKIASLGLKVRGGRCYHGLALNVAMDLAPFSRINPCGYAGLRMCQVSDFAPGMSVEALKPRLAHHLAERLRQDASTRTTT